MCRGIPYDFRLHLRFAICDPFPDHGPVKRPPLLASRRSCYIESLIPTEVTFDNEMYERRDTYRIPYCIIHTSFLHDLPIDFLLDILIRSTWDGSFAVSEKLLLPVQLQRISCHTLSDQLKKKLPLPHARRITSCPVFRLVRSCRGRRCSRIGNTLSRKGNTPQGEFDAQHKPTMCIDRSQK